MDIVTLGAALALAPKAVLPAASASDVGEALVVGADGSWEKGAVTGATITVNGTTLTITPGGE